MTGPDIEDTGGRPVVSHPVDPARLPKDAPYRVDLALDSAECAALADLLGVIALRKVRLGGELAALGKRDWRFSGMLGATVVQPCVVTLEPVTSRIDEAVERVFRAASASDSSSDEFSGGETEMPDEVDEEPLDDTIDLGAVLAEALALALPLYPRAPGVELGDTRVAPPGVTPMSEEETRPFAGLAALRDKMQGDDEDGE